MAIVGHQLSGYYADTQASLTKVMDMPVGATKCLLFKRFPNLPVLMILSNFGLSFWLSSRDHQDKLNLFGVVKDQYKDVLTFTHLHADVRRTLSYVL